MHGHMGATKPALGSRVVVASYKDYESAAEGRECFLEKARKDKRDGASLSG